MALLDSGSSSTFTGASATANVAVSAGSGNRKLIIGFAMESVVSVDELDFNGSDLVALGLEIALTAITSDGVSSCIMFEQFEAGLPASGSHTITATFSGSATGGGRMFYWLVDGVEQGELAEGGSGGVNNGGSSTSTFQTDETFVAGDDDRACFSVAYRNDNATSLLLTTPGSATNVADVTITGGGRVSGSHKVGSMGTGTVRPTWTTQATGQNRRTGAACMLNPATGGAVRTASGAITLGAVEVAGEVTAVATRTASGAIVLGAVEVAGEVTAVATRTASGAIVLGGLEVSGEVTALATREASGAMELGAVEVDGTATVTPAGAVERDASGAFDVGHVAADGLLTLITIASGAVGLGALQVAGTATRRATRTASGAITLGALEVAGVAGGRRFEPGIPGTVIISDRAFGSASPSDSAFGSVLVSDRAVGEA